MTRLKLTDICERVKAPHYNDVEGDLDISLLPNNWSDCEILKVRFENLAAADTKLQKLLSKEIPKPSRSEYDFAIIQILKMNDWSLNDAATVLRLLEVGKGKDLTARELVRAYNRAPNPYLDMKISDADIEFISTQTPPDVPFEIASGELDSSSGTASTEDFVQEWESGADMDWKSSNPQLYKNLMGLGEVGCIYGMSNIGKSFIAIDIAGHLAAGKDWANFKLKSKGAAYILAAEGSGGYKKRISGLRKRLGMHHSPTLQEFPLVVHRKQLDLVGDPKTSVCPDLDKLIKQIKNAELKTGVGFKLIIVDTLAAVFGGKNENDAADASKFVANMYRLAFETGATVVFVHHEGKSAGTGLRGSSALTGNIDFIFEVKETKYENAVKKEFTAKKQKDSDKNIVIEFKLPIIELGKDDDGDPVTTCFINLSTESEFVSVIPEPPNLYNSLETEGQKIAYKATWVANYHKQFETNDILRWYSYICNNLSMTIKDYQNLECTASAQEVLNDLKLTTVYKQLRTLNALGLLRKNERNQYVANLVHFGALAVHSEITLDP